MIGLSTLIASGAQIPQNISDLPHYNTDICKDLPPDAAPTGVLANGDIYFNSYKMLTPNDISLLKQATGESFDPATIDGERAAGTFQGDALAAAIGFDRANEVLGLGGLSGNITAGYLQSIENAISDPKSDGSYEGFKISQSEIEKVLTAFADQSSNSTTSISA